MTQTTAPAPLGKLQTGISGLDQITYGGLPKSRTTLVSGTAGSAKTIFACQFLAEGIRRFEEPGVFVTFEESPQDIRVNNASMGWDIARWEAEGRWRFVDASLHSEDEVTYVGSFDFGGLLARLEAAVRQIGARRLVMDSLGAVFTQFHDRATVRRELHRLARALRQMGVTTVMTSERTEEYGDIARYGVEEFVADNVIILRNALEEEKRRRTIEVLKLRGAAHQRGEFPLSLIPQEGIVVVPLSAIELKQRSSDRRITSGNASLDAMCGGGLFRDSIVLVSGATGTGKTLTTTEFVKGGCFHQERCLLFAFEESREQLFRNASGWGVDFGQMEREGLLRVVCEYPETAPLEDHLVNMRKLINEFEPQRVAVDSLSALERVSTPKSFREFVIALTSFIKHKEITGLFTSTTSTLMGAASVTEAHISTITDSIILLRYIEMFGEIRRGVTVLKMRGSAHEKVIREFTIDGAGMHIGDPFREVSGVLSGHPHLARMQEIDRVSGLFS
jgi:circadian clock protein KaiC